jgi:Uncharacterized protein conserved in bacteria (DUF2188)
MARGWIHTTYRDGVWVNEVEGGQRASSTHKTKGEAVPRGRQLAQKARTEHVVHNKDGTIGYRNSYGSDPHPPPG